MSRRPPSKIRPAEPEIRPTKPEVRPVQTGVPGSPFDPFGPRRTLGASGTSPKNAELRSKIAKLDGELTELRTAARHLAELVHAQELNDRYCSEAAQRVLDLMPPSTPTNGDRTP